MYHDFVPDGVECDPYTTTDTAFREDIQWLKDNGYTFLHPSELTSGAPLPERGVLIAIDDGYSSNYHIAYPILQELEAKASIALITSHVEMIPDHSITWDMCREMLASGVIEFGSHTNALHIESADGTPHGIKPLPEEAREDYVLRVTQDLETSVSVISTELGTAPTYFVYPYGLNTPWDYPIVESLFSLSLTTREGSCNISGGLHRLNRYNINTQRRPWHCMPGLPQEEAAE